MPQSKKSKPPVTLSLAAEGDWYAIMLDYELDLMPGRWPIRAPSLSLDEVQTEMWIVENLSLVPSVLWEATLLHSKGLADKITKEVFSGGIYRFRAPRGGVI